MLKHLGFAIIGGLLFFGATLVTLKLSDSGVQHFGLFKDLSQSDVLKAILKASVWVGVLTGGLTSMAMRKSVNRNTYVWIALILSLIFTEFVISTIY
jgi:glucose uptake protein GlcU